MQAVAGTGAVPRTARAFWTDHLFRAVGLALVYAAATQVGRHLIIPAVFIAPIRLAAAVAGVALMLSPTITWGLYLVALVPVHLFLRTPSNGFSVALQYFAASASAAVVVAVLVRRWIGVRPTLDSLRHCLAFLAAGVVLAPMAAATIGTPSISRRDLTVSPWSTWETWLAAEAVGMLVVVPTLLALPGLVQHLRKGVVVARPAGAMVLGVGIFMATVPTLGGAKLASPASLSLLYIPFPFLVWAAIRFGPAGAALANLELAVITVAAALYARGPFGGAWSGSAVPAVQQFLIVTCGTSITLAGLVAERWRTLGALAESEARYRELVESANDMILLTTPDGGILEVNRAFESGTGWRAEDWRGRTVFDFLVRDEHDLARHELLGARRGPTETSRWQVVVKDGTQRTLEIRTTAYGEDEAVARVMVLARDVTQQIRAEEERAMVEAELQQSRKMQAVGQLAGGIAHDFNNLLQALSGYTDLAVDALPAEHAALQPMRNVAKVADRAATLTRQLLAFSRRDELQPEQLDLGAVVTDFVRILRRMIGEHIQISVSVAPGATPISGDRNQIEQIVMNLCINARDAMPSGGPLSIETGTVTYDADACRERRWAREGTWAVLRVSDRGTGISDAILPHIFEPFFTTKAVGLGTGLGLATVYAIVQRHGGFVGVEPNPGGGVSFVVCFPTTAAAAEPRAVEALQRPATALSGHGETLLLAEDEELVRELAVEVLETAGYRVLVARDGREAQVLVQRHAHEIDLALLDVVMPFRSGREVYDEIQQVRPDLPVLFSTGYSFGELSGLPAASREATLAKPYKRHRLLEAVRAALDHDAARPRDATHS